MKLLDGRPAPIPVAVVDLEDLKSGSQYQGVGDHRVVHRIRVLDDVEVLADGAFGVREEGELGPDAVTELVELELAIRRDHGDARVGDPEVEVRLDEMAQVAVFFGLEAPTG